VLVVSNEPGRDLELIWLLVRPVAGDGVRRPSPASCIQLDDLSGLVIKKNLNAFFGNYHSPLENGKQ
jgi:hypothetical protein